MKKILLISLFATISSQAVMAGADHLNCEAYRISQDANSNIQTFTITPYEVSLHNSGPLEVISGDARGVPTKFVLKGIDGKGDYSVEIKVKSKIASLSGNQDIGREHTIDLTKVEVIASRAGKTQNFIGTCKLEQISSCGGGCTDESEERDTL